MGILSIKNKDGEDINLLDNLRIYRQIAGKYKWYFVLAIVILIVSRAAMLFEKFIFKEIIDRGTEFVAGDIVKEVFISILITVAIIFVVSIIIRAAARWYLSSVERELDSKMVLDLKTRFFSHIVNLSKSFHDSHKTGSMISRLGRGAGGIERVNEFFLSAIGILVIDFILVGASIIYFDVNTAISIFIMSIVFVIYNFFIIRLQQPANIEANLAEDIEKGLVADVFTNIDSVKYFGKEKPINNKYYGLAETTRLKNLAHTKYYQLLDFGQTLILMIGTFVIMLLPLIKLVNGEMTVGTIAFIYTSYLNLIFPLYNFVGGVRSFYKGMADFDALFEYDKISNEIEDKSNAQNIDIKTGSVEFNDVKFSYGKRKIFDNLNFKIKPNEKIALVGHSGSGKTTLVKLLYRLYDANSGEILIDGKNIKEFKQESLRSELSIVPQEAILFDDTIYNNILFSNSRASRKEVMNAIKFAQLDEFIKNLPKKENTIVGERGVKLSGGEKQRVSIARAILANKKILVLDEATSSLDSKTEHQIQQDLHKLMQGRTTIIIAHRLSTIMSADKIVVMDKGKIVQVGKHSELIKKKGIYQELWNLQKGGYIGE